MVTGRGADNNDVDALLRYLFHNLAYHMHTSINLVVFLMFMSLFVLWVLVAVGCVSSEEEQVRQF